jgi:transposase
MRVDVLAGVERRRRWSADEKVRIVEETLQPGAKVMEVAQRNQVSRSVVFAGRRMARVGQLGTEPSPAFVPVHVEA